MPINPDLSKDQTAEEAEKAQKDALEAADNPPQPYPSQEQANKILAGEPVDDDEDPDNPNPAPRKPGDPRPPHEPAPAPSKTGKAVEADKPAGYSTR